MNDDRLPAPVPEQIECVGCGATLLAVAALGPSPIDRDDCPNCGGEEFEFAN